MEHPSQDTIPKAQRDNKSSQNPQHGVNKSHLLRSILSPLSHACWWACWRLLTKCSWLQVDSQDTRVCAHRHMHTHTHTVIFRGCLLPISCLANQKHFSGLQICPNPSWDTSQVQAHLCQVFTGLWVPFHPHPHSTPANLYVQRTPQHQRYNWTGQFYRLHSHVLNCSFFL